MNYCYLFLLFIVYSFLGWLIEVLLSFQEHHKFINRGFLIGPYCPIYGVGSILVTILLKDYMEHPLGVFVISIFICAIVEYFGSFIMEKIFHTRWWDYSKKKYNINGRICLETLIPFGVASIYVVYFLNPFLNNLLMLIPDNIILILTIVIAIIFVGDFCYSFKIIWKFRTIGNDIRTDSTEKVTKYVKKQIEKTRKKVYNRIIQAFPGFEVIRKYDKKKNKKKKNKKL